MRDDIVHRIGRDLPDVPRFHSLFDATPRRWQKSDVSRRVRLSADNLRQVEDWIDRLEEETSSSAPGSDFIAEAYLALIIAVLVRRTPQRADGPKKSSLGITRALAWIEKNFHQPLRVADLAQQAGMSERTFFREFQRKMNTSPSDYLIQYRIERAAEWLRKSPRTYRISEVSEGCGFGDSNYFSTCFRRLKGCAPREYRGPTPLQS
ncbi:AraC-like DNA-binding protein [Puniceicoccus vermicola]